MVSSTAAILIICLFLSYLWVKKRFRYWTDKGFLQGDSSFPLGSLSEIGRKVSYAEKMDYYYKKFKGKAPAIGIYHFFAPVILLIDTQLIKNVLVRDFTSFHDRGLYYNKRDDPVGANTFTLSGQDWKDRRMQLAPIFTSGKIKMMFEIVNMITDKFVRVIQEEITKSPELEMHSWLQRYTTDNFVNAIFGIDPNSLENKNSEFIHYGSRMVDISFSGILRFIFGTEFPCLARKLKVGFAPKDVGDFFLKTFIKTFDIREKSEAEKVDFVTLLLGLKDVYTKEELAAEAFIFFFGGFETSRSLMTFLMYEFAANPDIQDRLREEIMTGIENNDGKLTYDLIFEFKYLDMVVSEGLRKYPPLPTSIRKCVKAYKIPDTELVIPEGTTIIVNLFSYQRDPEHFPNLEKFDPERFNEENIKNIKSSTNIPFGEGPRTCLGMRFAKMQTKMGLVKLIRAFKMEPCEKTQIPLKISPIQPMMTPEKGVWLKLIST